MSHQYDLVYLWHPIGIPLLDLLQNIGPLYKKYSPISSKKEDRAIAGFSMGEFKRLILPYEIVTGPVIGARWERNPSFNLFKLFYIAKRKDSLTAMNNKLTLNFV